MKKRIRLFMAILFLLGAVQVSEAQSPSRVTLRNTTVRDLPGDGDSQAAAYYRLDFVIRELDGEKLLDSRDYSLWVQSGDSQSMTAGSEIPYPGATYNTAGSGTTRSVNYRNVGVKIECVVKKGDVNPSLDLFLNISDVLPPEKDSESPAFRSVSMKAKALLSLGKPVTVGIVEDPASRHRYQVDVTATELQ